LNAVAFSWAHRQNKAGSSDAQLCAGSDACWPGSAAARGGSTNTAAAAAPATLNIKRLLISRLLVQPGKEHRSRYADVFQASYRALSCSAA
jgi:hypothetical protein